MANAPMVKMLGYRSFDELAKGNGAKLDPIYGRRRLLEILERDGTVRGLESEWRRVDGLVVHVRENATAVRDENGKIAYYEGTVEDVTEWKQSQEALRESQALFNSLVNSLPQRIFCKDLEGRFTFANTAFCLQLASRFRSWSARTTLISSRLTSPNATRWMTNG